MKLEVELPLLSAADGTAGTGTADPVAAAVTEIVLVVGYSGRIAEGTGF